MLDGMCELGVIEVSRIGYLIEVGFYWLIINLLFWYLVF